MPGDAQIVNQVFLRTDSHERSQKPAVPGVALMHIRSRRSVNKELWLVENVFHALHPRRRINLINGLSPSEYFNIRQIDGDSGVLAIARTFGKCPLRLLKQ